MIHSIRKYAITIILVGGVLLIIGLLMVNLLHTKTVAPVVSSTVSTFMLPITPMDPTLAATLAPTIIPILQISPVSTTRPVIHNSRISELHDLGVELMNQQCVAPCQSKVKSPLTLGEFIQKVGVPEKVYGSLLSPEKPDIIATLIYVRKGFFVHASRYAWYNSKWNFETTPEMNIDRIDLWNSRTLNELSIELSKAYQVDFHLEKVQDWTGFGPLKPPPK
jgi:hypothetical protein